MFEPDEKFADLPDMLDELSDEMFSFNVAQGWYHDPETGEPLPQRNIMEMLMLMVTELAEAAEGWRKDLQDDHLPEFSSVEVEFADVLIRMVDTAGYIRHLAKEKAISPIYLGFSLGNALMTKHGYNRRRADHKLSNRAQPGGKKC